MKDLRINLDDIHFQEEIFVVKKYDTIYAYLCETDTINKIAGLYTDKSHENNFHIKYYGIYDYKCKTFKIEIGLILYCTYNQLKKDFPEIENNIIDIAEKKRKGENVYLNLSNKEEKLFFDKFQKFCLDEFKTMNYKSNTFEELVKEIKKHKV